MQIEFQKVLQAMVETQSFNRREKARFSAIDFRLGIQWLVSEDQPDLAQSLADAGLTLFPSNEDILAIAGLLAITRQDWPLAIKLLQDLIFLQNDNIQPMTYQMLARSLACNLDTAEAQKVLEKALTLWPNNRELQEEEKNFLYPQNF